MAYETNRFCWHGCITTDMERSSSFYTKTLGWNVAHVPMGDGEASVFEAQGKGFAHIAPPLAEETPSHWSNYLRVEDVDTSTAAAVANGGILLAPATDIPPGRFSVVSSPSGAALVLFREASAEMEHGPTGPGTVHWVELHSLDVAADLAWLTATFGFEIETMPMPNGDYFLLKSDGEARGGVMPAMPNAPAMWLTWFNVVDADATIAAAEDNGGAVLSPAFDVPGVGRMGIVTDPTGSVVGVITPA